MDKENDKLKLEDITFEDFISDGLTAEETKDDAVVEEKKEVKEEVKEISEELDEDIKDVKEDIPSVKKEASTPTPKAEAPIEDGESEVDETVINEVLTQLGYEFPDQEFNDDTDGLVQLAKAVGTKMAEDQLDGLFQAYPEIQKHLDFVLNGGKSDDWMKMSNSITDFEKISINEDDMRTQRAVLGEYFKLKGHDSAFVNELLDDYTDSNKLFDKAKKARVALSNYYGKQRDTSIAQAKQEQLAAQQKQREFWDDISDTIQSSKEFAGITVQEKDKNQFFDYLTKPDQSGRTQRERDHQESATEVKLAIDYLMFKGFNLKDIVAAKAKTKNARSLRKKIKSNNSVKGSAR